MELDCFGASAILALGISCHAMAYTFVGERRDREAWIDRISCAVRPKDGASCCRRWSSILRVYAVVIHEPTPPAPTENSERHS